MDSPSRLHRLVVAPPTSNDLTDEQFRAFSSRLAYIAWRLSANGTRLLAPQWCVVTGRYEHELQRDAWLETIHPDDRARVNAEVRGAIIYKSHIECDLRLRHKDGSYHWYRMRGEPIHGQHDVVGWTGLLLKIDSEKAAQWALGQTEERLRTIIDAARVGTIEHDLETGVIRLSDHALTLMDLPRNADVSLKDVIQRIHPEDRAKFIFAMKRASDPSSDGAFEVTMRVPHRNGRVQWVVSRGVYQFEGSGASRKAVRFVGAAGDMTEQLHDLSESARLGAIVSSSQDAIIATTLDGKITDWNDAAEHLFGYTAKEVLNTSVCRLTPVGLQAECHAHIAAVGRGDSVIGRTTRRQRKDGSQIDVSLTLSLIRDREGVGTGISAIIRDVSNQVRLETELSHVQKMEALGRLAGGVAHDLNNTLTAILAGLDWTSRTAALSDEARAAFADIRSETYRASGLVRDLLAVAQRQVISPTATSLNAAIRDIAPMLGRMLGEDITLEVNERATRGAYVDEAQLTQVLLNLAINARDAMPTGGTLTLTTADAADEHQVALMVRDNGCGMTPEVLARIFEPFYSTKPPGLATGLGLSTAYGIIAQSEGTIHVESEVGVGTTFSIQLPAVAEPAREPRVSSPVAVQRGAEHLLVVEDNTGVRRGLVESLRAEGYEVLEADCGAKALELVEQSQARIEFVISDVVMPNMNGIEMLSRLRRKLPTVPAVFITGYSEKAVANYGVIAPDTELIQKPFDVAELTTRIRRRLDRGVLALTA